VFQLVSLLLNSGADVNATKAGGWSVLHKACESGNTDLVSILLTSGRCEPIEIFLCQLFCLLLQNFHLNILLTIYK
jgi:ankyrin repeat protein